ncbi:hypothetical protein JANAI62_27430 [Jannaschia pagri]|uniref:Glycosyl transferase family 2 n=1 Tax=Jannaschia pagri TaxID=2829797 RepID=A0ABQ4NPB5_9RHOB|nr:MULTISPECIES: glycosyltransferase family 2 protein [unclassified Jannaschia]GIT92286.1 hypothetical protein JANAI61_27440 [Jannaschia sp. AI_61]GIT96120.1 hypothetical protein JANAI62_27430 [Jannaschia sp. AI_62]
MIEHRTLTAQTVGDIRVLDVVADLPDGAGQSEVRVFLGAGTPTACVTSVDGLSVDRVLSVSSALMVTGTWNPERAGLPLPLQRAATSVPPATPEPGLLAGCRVLMATRNGEPAATVADWMRYHATRHGADAALILDRRRPGEASLADDLAALPGRDALALSRCVVVDCPLPLGKHAASERHPMAAPDAPGKDRMVSPEPDPWTAPLADLIVLEALRWRFLTEARAVAWLDICDILVPVAPGHGVFDLVAASETGLVPLVGRRIYPWRVRKGRYPHYGDHICDQFDEAGGNRRWACDPRRIPPEAPFRLVRIGGMTPDPRVAYFYRAMAVRCHEDLELPLAPKAGLVLDDDLLALSKDAFGHSPVLPPISADAGGPLPASVPGRTAIVTCMKNEGPFILEWIAYHRAIGVDDFLVYTNDCTDGTDRLLDLLQSHRIVQHRDNPFRTTDMKPQHAALAAAESEPIMARAGWAICMDVDEYINVHVGDGHLRDLFGAVGDANMISATWRLFGNGDHHLFDTAPTIERFTSCAPQLIRKPHQAWGFKTLFRNMNIYRKFGVHRPKGLRPDLWEQVRWVNGSGQPMPKEMLRTGWRSSLETYGYDLVTLNHYAVRDAESFLVKRDRGRVNHVERDQGLGYWFRMNNNAEQDISIQRMLPAMRTEMERLLALPGVAEAHAACLAAHRARVQQLRAGDAFGSFFAEITSARMERLSRLHKHFGANVFLAGPDCIPDEVVTGDLAEDFFFTVKDVDETAH